VRRSLGKNDIPFKQEGDVVTVPASALSEEAIRALVKKKFSKLILNIVKKKEELLCTCKGGLIDSTTEKLRR
jgi:RNA polymerase-interacting CarD/CdnL/TRCF family regulator